MKTAPARLASKKEAIQPKAVASDGKRYFWRKLTASKWGDAWVERLTFLGPQRVLLIEFPNAPKVRVEAHGLTAKEADDLLIHFGGMVREMTIPTSYEPELRPPINVRGRLLVVSSEAELTKHRAGKPNVPVVLIPAGMAFGTGEHATTSMCLRFLADLGKAKNGGEWEALDLGTGSGILAIAARIFGAASVEGCDFDPHAVRTAKENVRLNGITKVKMKRLDVTRWVPERTWDVVIANLFSGLLVQVAKPIASAIAPGGHLILSGILREQEEEVLEALRKQKVETLSVTRKGKWVSAFAVKLARNRAIRGKEPVLPQQKSDSRR